LGRREAGLSAARSQTDSLSSRLYIYTPEKFESIDLPLLPLCDESYSRWHGRRSCVVVVVCRAVLWNLFIIVQAPRMYYNGTATAALFVYVRSAKRHIAKKKRRKRKKIGIGRTGIIYWIRHVCE